jgi:hypothetical protein
MIPTLLILICLFLKIAFEAIVAGFCVVMLVSLFFGGVLNETQWEWEHKHARALIFSGEGQHQASQVGVMNPASPLNDHRIAVSGQPISLNETGVKSGSHQSGRRGQATLKGGSEIPPATFINPQDLMEK